jgi:Zn-dependent protease with chaperone function
MLGRSLSMPKRTWCLASCSSALVASVIIATSTVAADQHSVEAIIAAMQSPVSQEAVAQARQFDDQIMSAGGVEGVRHYLVTDERSARANAMVVGLVRGAGQNPVEWLVRVLDTDPKIVNAFVVGGKYVYVYTGLLAESPSDDELAFILSHELGHSLLKHKERQANDNSATWAAIARLGALFSEKNRSALNGVSTVITNSYSRVDEQEADAIACCIARRAGYDPLRGADFFTRFQRAADASRQQREQLLAEAKAACDQALAICVQNKQLFNSSRSYQTQENADKVNAMCRDAETRCLQYSQVAEAYDAATQEARRNVLLSDHPQDQSRIAAIAALSDFFAGRRDMASLASFQQSQRVMTALVQEKSELLKAGVPATTPTASSDSSSSSHKLSLEEQLKQLQRVRDAGLITQAEYERKRQEILARY